jgi:hypothetical protein
MEQGRKLELALVFDLMPREQAVGLSPGQRTFALALQGLFRRSYPNWHANSAALIREIEPKKFEEFVSYCLESPSRKGSEVLTGPLKKWFEGQTEEFPQFEGLKFFNGPAMVSAFFANQLRILASCNNKLNPISQKPHLAGVVGGL